MIVAPAIFALSVLVTQNCVFAEPDSSELSCREPYRTPINETTSEILSDGSIRTIQGDVFDSDDYIQVNGTKQGCLCHLKTCIRKCCPEGEMLVDYYCNGTINVLKGLAIPEKVGPALNNFHVTYGIDCGTSDRLEYVVDARKDGDFYISEKGVLTLSNADNYEFFDYCLDYNEEYEVIIISCQQDPNNVSTESWLYIVGMLISAPFLLLTFIVHALLPETNVYNRFLMCYVMSLMLGNVILVIMRLIPLTPVHSSCTFIGTLCYFFYLVSFCTINVMAYDIWSTFRNIRAPAINSGKNEKKRMLFYSLYVLGIPLVVVAVVITLTKTSKLTAWYNPNMGVGKCWFSNMIAFGIYFYLAMTIAIFINIILFASTAWNIKKIQNDTKQLEGKDSKKHEKSKQMFSVYLKLSLAMGINWTMEIIGWAADQIAGKTPEAIWYLTNVCNTLYGVFIFFLFVFKKSIWKQLEKRFNNTRVVASFRKKDCSQESHSSTSTMSNNTNVTEI